MTGCTTNITKIDHLSIEFKKNTTEEFTDFENELIEILRQFGIKIKSKKPRSMSRFTRGNLLYAHSSLSKIKAAGSIKVNANQHLLKLEINGSQCEKINLSQQGFNVISELSFKHRGIIRRIDICYDDFTGRYNIRRVGQDYSASRYDSVKGVRPKKASHESTGKTLNIGSKLSYKFLKVYDKSAEQRLPSIHPLYKKWFRHEVTLKNQGKILIPLTAINHPDGIFLDAYPKAHRKFLKNVTPISIKRIATIQTASTFYNKIEVLRKQRGRTVRMIRDVVCNDTEALNLIVRNGLPSGITRSDDIENEEIRNELAYFFDENSISINKANDD